MGDEILNTRDKTDFDKFLSGQVNNKEEQNQPEVDYFDDFVTRANNTEMVNEYKDV